MGTPAYAILYLLPFFRGLQPSRAGFLVTFGVGMLGALALDRLMDGQWELDRRAKQGLIAGILTIILIPIIYTIIRQAELAQHWNSTAPELGKFALLLTLSLLLLVSKMGGWLSSRSFGWLALLLCIVDLYSFWGNFNTIGRVDQLYPPSEIVTYLQNDQNHEVSRMSTLSKGIVFYPNSNLAERLPALSGYEPGIPLRLVHYMELAEGDSVIRQQRLLLPQAGINSPLVDALNVKHVVTAENQWGMEPSPDIGQPSVTKWAELPANTPFTMSHAGLQNIQLPLRQQDATGTVTTRVLSADGGYEFAHAVLNADNIIPEDWHPFPFTPFPSDWGRAFQLVVNFEGDGLVEIGLDDAGNPAFQTNYLPRPALLHEANRSKIYINEGYFPRAFAVPQAEIMPDETATLLALQANQTQLNQILFLELAGNPAPPHLGQPNDQPIGTTTITSYQLNAIEIAVNFQQDGFLLLADGYDSGWIAQIDGGKTPVYRANSVIRGIFVPAGEHLVTFRFQPVDFYLSGVISLMSAGICLLTILFQSRKR